MRISNCLHPQKIYNKYLCEWQYVPCGKCEACRNIQSYGWQQRIVQESRKHRYNVFFTLTYDDDCVPRLFKLEDGSLVDLGRKTRKIYKGNIFESSEYSGNFISKDEIPLANFEDLRYFKRYNDFTYPCVTDCQRFIKRLRSNIHELYKKNQESDVSQSETEEDYRIRYVLVSEYGPSSFRVHYHGNLWFESRELAKKIKELICSSWLMCDRSRIDVQFANTGVASYVAKYINSSVHLPSLYKHPSLRPFILCSRRPFIASGLYSREKVRQILDNSVTHVRVYDAKKQSYIATSHFRSFTDKFLPKCIQFGKLTDSDRVSFYLINKYKGIESKEHFLANALFSPDPVFSSLRRIFNKYYNLSNLNRFAYKKTFDSFFSRIYYTSRCVIRNAKYLGYDSPEEYVRKIIAYWNQVSKENLKSMYEFQQEYVKDHSCKDLSALYPLSCDDFYDVLYDSFDYHQMSSLQKKIHMDMENNKKRKSFLRMQKMDKSNIRYYV